VQVPRPLVDLAGYESLHSSQLDDTSSNPNGPSPRQSQIDSPDQKVGRRQQILHHHSLGSPLSSLPAQPLTRGIPSSPLVCSSSLQYISSSFESLKEVKEEDTLLPVSDQLLLNDSSSSTWEFHTQVPAPQVRDKSQGLDVVNGHRRAGTPLSSVLSNSSYHSVRETPPNHTPFSGNHSRPQTASSRSSFGEELILDSIESSHRTILAAMEIGSLVSGAGASELPMSPDIAPHATGYNVLSGGSTLPIQNSIEGEEPSSNEEQSSSNSKISSSQQSADNERDVPQVAGLAQPTLPILGRDEYVLALSCEGKIKSTYADIIKAKERAIKKFLSRHESIGSANSSPTRTYERNEMADMIQQLHDTVTHMDLGLPGFSTQYDVNSQEHAAYANYAGSKFTFLGFLVDMLKVVGVSIVMISREGEIQDLLEQYLKMKHIVVKRPDRMARSKSPASDRVEMDFQVILVGAGSTYGVDLRSRPCLMIAFDTSFDAQDPQVVRIRTKFGRPPHLMPVLHLLITNSSEHVDRCLSKNLPSPVRLKALVRYTCQALPNLGGKLVYIEDESDVPEYRDMDASDLQRGLRKSIDRKIYYLAQRVGHAIMSPHFQSAWNLGSAPPLDCAEFDETPSTKPSRNTTRPETPRELTARSRTPASRSGTPSGRKRLLADLEGVLPALPKRQRLTPLGDLGDMTESVREPSTQVVQLQEVIKKQQAELAAATEARRTAEQETARLKQLLEDYQRDHAGLQRRYEKRMTKCHELDRDKTKLMKTIENNKSRQDRVQEENTNLRQTIKGLQAELGTLRDEFKAGGPDAAALEDAREEARSFATKNAKLEKSLENTRRDFEFTRSQYQNASTQATDLAGQVKELEEEKVKLTKLASDERRRLLQMNHEDAISRPSGDGRSIPGHLAEEARGRESATETQPWCSDPWV
jgi:hypothetical protein